MTTQRVVGVSYDMSTDASPQVLLKAAGEEAAAVLRDAQAREVPTVRNPELVDQLYRVPLDAPIGRELFPVMAAVLAHVLRLDARQTEDARE